MACSRVMGTAIFWEHILFFNQIFEKFRSQYILATITIVGEVKPLP